MSNQSNHIGQLGDKIKVTVKLDAVIELYTNKWGTCFISVFSTADGDIITYMGKSMVDKYLNALGANKMSVEAQYDLEKELQINRPLGERENTFIGNGQYITLSGTIKDHTVYNNTNQTLIQRPKISK